MAESPVRFAEIYHGEEYDARLEIPGWSTADFDDSGWMQAAEAPPPQAHLQWQESPPIRAIQSLAPVVIARVATKDWVVDFGQNFAGWCRIRVKGERGHKVVLRHAELLAEDGQVDMRNLRTARATDRYVLRGDPAGESWEPQFTYHGFRYVQISGWPGELNPSDIEGVVVHSDLPITGHLESSQPVVAGLWRNTMWSQRSNFVGIPTDCPQRDERMGWTGDAQIFWPTATYNMDVRRFTRRFLADLRASQQPGGAYMDTNPPAMPAAGCPGWSDAGVVLPHTVWRHYDDVGIVGEHWRSMQRWMAWIADANPEGLWRARREVDFGDHLSLDSTSPMDETTPKLLTATACWARMLGMMEEMSIATDRVREGRMYGEWLSRVRSAFEAEFIRPDGSIGNGSHTGYILSLAFGLVPETLRAKTARRLAENIRHRGTLLTTGFLGTPFSLDVLADHGHEDLAVELLLRTQYPGWGYMVSKGATTIWERWNSDVSDFAMNSFNHYALGAATGFLYRRVAGIERGSNGFAQVRCRPLLDARLGAGSAWHDTVRGRIETRWGVQDDHCWHELVVPSGMSAEIVVPGANPRTVGAGSHRMEAPWSRHAS